MKLGLPMSLMLSIISYVIRSFPADLHLSLERGQRPYRRERSRSAPRGARGPEAPVYTRGASALSTPRRFNFLIGFEKWGTWSEASIHTNVS
jgi:hypothetical protein